MLAQLITSGLFIGAQEMRASGGCWRGPGAAIKGAAPSRFKMVIGFDRTDEPMIDHATLLEIIE